MANDGRFTEDQCLLFHSRFIFAHRQEKEQAVLNLFGVTPEPANARRKGHVLIATQVVEQSLDLDFDWMIPSFVLWTCCFNVWDACIVTQVTTH